MWLALAVPFASAHIELLKPSPVTADQKQGPCGAGDHARGADVAVYRPGETIRVKWTETINHPATYRIALDVDGDDDFEDPSDVDDFYTNDTVLLDEIGDEDDQSYNVAVTLPLTPCETCTLQLIQLMLDKPPYEPGTNDIYYQCADIAIRGEPVTGDAGGTADTSGPAGEADASKGCETPGGSPYAPALALAALASARRRRTGPNAPSAGRSYTS